MRVAAIGAGIGCARGQRVPSGDWLPSMPSAMVPTLRSLHRSELHRALVESLNRRKQRRAQGAFVGSPVR